jgi:hypothetical protein
MTTWLARFKDDSKYFPALDEALNSVSKALIASGDYTNDCDKLRSAYARIDEIEEAGLFEADKWSVKKTC